MPTIVWDKPEERTYETGLDRGVLYLPDGTGVAWNGLTSVIESFDGSTSPVYYDGMKINDGVVLGDFNATMKAITYPDEFVEIEGVIPLRRGLSVGEQNPQLFGLCYRTQIGDASAGDTTGYKIHVIYNLTAIPSDKTYATQSADPSLVEFEWKITAVPEEVPGHRPTAHFVIEVNKVDPWLLEHIESVLYGNTSADASLVPMQELVTFIENWYRVKIYDNGDGTWTAVEQRAGFITMLASDLFQIAHINAVYVDPDTFIISDTIDAYDVPQIKISDNGNGTWSATTEHDDIISVDSLTGQFEIRNANAVMLDANRYSISDTPED